MFDSVPFSDIEISRLRSAFNSLDADEDGHVSRSDVLKLVNTTELFGLAGAKVDLTAARPSPTAAAAGVPSEALNKQTARFLEQLDLLDKDDSVSWEPFLFSVAAAFHTLGPKSTANDDEAGNVMHSKAKRREAEEAADKPCHSPEADQ